MKKLFILAFITTLFISVTFAQNQDFSSIIKRMDNLMSNNYPEKIYLQTDRSVYQATDTIWFQAWVLQAGYLLPTEKSKWVYVDLINEKSGFTQTSQYKIENGMAHGQFILPKLQDETETYRLRAYTRWQKNFGDNACFEKAIPVWSNKRQKENESDSHIAITRKSGRKAVLSQEQYQRRQEKEKEKQEALRNEEKLKLDVQFLPEGGKLIEGIPNRIAIKALLPDGTGANIIGDIKDANGEVVTSFEAIHKGMGSFMLVPEAGQSYKAVLFDGKEYTLPKIETEGVNLMVVTKPNSDSIIVAVNGSKSTYEQRKDYILVVDSRGLLTPNAFRVQMNRPRVMVTIPTEGLLEGIQRLTLFDETYQPVCERLVYLKSKSTGNITFDYKAKWQAKSDAEQVMTLKVNPLLKGQPALGAYGLSVTNSKIVSIDNPSQTLVTEMLLASELKGIIEDPDYYFSNPYDSIYQKLDLVMLTHGWRGFNWTTDLNRPFTYHPDTTVSISGRVTNLLKKPSKDRKISLFMQGKQTLIDDTYTNNDGRFIFKDLNIQGNSIARVTIEREGKEKNQTTIGLSIKFDSIHNNRPVFPIAPLVERRYEETFIENLIDLYQDSREEDKKETDSIQKRYGYYMLDEVTLSEQKRIEGSRNRNGGTSDIAFDSLDLTKHDNFTSVIDILKSEVPGFTKNSKAIRIRNNKTCNLQYEHYKIGNKIVFFQIDGEFLIDDIGEYNRSFRIFDTKNVFIQDTYDHLSNVGYIDEILNNLVATDIKGIEVLNSKTNLYAYFNEGFDPVLDLNRNAGGVSGEENEDGSFNWNMEKMGSGTGEVLANIIVITTKKARGTRETQKRGIYLLQVNGNSVPREFYVPKYYPEYTYDRLIFDKRPVLYWNPCLVTDDKGVIEVTFPTGAAMKEHLQFEIEGIDGKGNVGSERQFIRLD